MTSSDPYHSKRLDVHKSSHHREINDLVELIWTGFSQEELDRVTTKGNHKPLADAKSQLKTLLLDMYVNWLSDPTLWTGISRSNNSYVPTSIYNGLHISKVIINVVDILMAHGLLEHYSFRHDREYGGRYSRTSRYRPSKQLQDQFSKLTLTLFDIDYHTNEASVILTDFETDETGEIIKTAGGKKKRKLIEYDEDDHPDIKSMREDLNAYNELLERTHIDISSLDDPYVERQKADGSAQKVSIDRSNQFVRRIFSRNSWNLNGRFYGGWWQQIGEDYREDIRIDGSPTIEVDFKGYHVAILANEQGISKPVDYDWYNFDEVFIDGFDAKTQRKALKLLVLTAINAKDKDKAFQAFRNNSRHRLENTQLELLLSKFIEKHPYLEEGICSDRGIDLMYKDSLVTSLIINEFVKKQEPILSVHDSYIVKRDSVLLLRDTMNKATKAVLSTSLPVDQGHFSKSQRQLILNAFRQYDYGTYVDYLQDPSVYPLHTPKITARYTASYQKFLHWRHQRYGY